MVFLGGEALVGCADRCIFHPCEPCDPREGGDHATSFPTPSAFVRTQLLVKVAEGAQGCELVPRGSLASASHPVGHLNVFTGQMESLFLSDCEPSSLEETPGAISSNSFRPHEGERRGPEQEGPCPSEDRRGAPEPGWRRLPGAHTAFLEKGRRSTKWTCRWATP